LGQQVLWEQNSVSKALLRRAKFNLAILEASGADLAEADLKGSDLDRAILAEPIPKIDKHIARKLPSIAVTYRRIKHLPTIRKIPDSPTVNNWNSFSSLDISNYSVSPVFPTVFN
jgi:uncharacterized protein YjbI with pentapeptide repeats